MSTSSSAEFSSVFAVPMALQYRDMAGHPISDVMIKPDPRSADGGSKRRADVELSEEEFNQMISRERADAAHLAEQRVRQEYEAKLQATRTPIVAAIAAFEAERGEYYSRVEAEIVQLALAIAAKILHREAQVEPMLVAALVRIAIEKMREGSSVTVRVAPGRGPRWKDYFAAHSNGARVEVKEDGQLGDLDCLLETEIGVANFGLDTQLKEVEQGFFDLLALKPVNR